MSDYLQMHYRLKLFILFNVLLIEFFLTGYIDKKYEETVRRINLKILHLNAGNETGGGMYHILRLLKKMKEIDSVQCMLGVFEKKELYQRAKDAKIPTIYFPNQTRFSLPLLRSIADFIKEAKITHVHTHGPRANVYMNYINKMLPINWVVTIHSDPLFDFHDKGIYGKLLTQLHMNAIKNAKQIIVVSETFYPIMIEAGAKRENIVTIHNGIDFQAEISEEFFDMSNLYDLRKQFGFTNNDFLILQVARLEKVKGHHIAFQALAKLIHEEQKSSFHLLLVGDGSLREELSELAKSLQIENHVHFYGQRYDVNTFYKLADITLLTSLSESFPYVLLESARAKTPVITTDVGDVRYLLVNEDFGWKVPVNNPLAVMNALKDAYQLFQDNRLKIVGEKLYSYASNYFSLDICVNDVYNVYKSMMQQEKNDEKFV